MSLEKSVDFLTLAYFNSWLPGVSALQAHPKENDSVDWSDDAGLFEAKASFPNSWSLFILPDEFLWSSK